MIKYSLRCGSGCVFEGWFRSSHDFEAQAQAGHLSCPQCGDMAIDRAIMAPAVHGARRRAGSAGEEEDGTPAGAQGASETPNATPAALAPPPPAPVDPARTMLMAMRALRRAVESQADHVGPRFAEEALKIHRGETPERAIYGEATEDENRTLAEEGVNVRRIPWAPLDDA